MNPVHPTETPAEAAPVISGTVVRTQGGGISLRVPGRSVAVGAVLLAVLVVVMGVSLTTGDFELSVTEVV